MLPAEIIRQLGKELEGRRFTLIAWNENSEEDRVFYNLSFISAELSDTEIKIYLDYEVVVVVISVSQDGTRLELTDDGLDLIYDDPEGEDTWSFILP